VNAAAVLAAALVQVPGTAGWLDRFVEMAAFAEPLLLASLFLLALLRRPLLRLPLRPAQAVVVALVAGLAVLLSAIWSTVGLADNSADSLVRAALLAGGTAALGLGYFELRARAFSPAVADARLAALNAFAGAISVTLLGRLVRSLPPIEPARLDDARARSFAGLREQVGARSDGARFGVGAAQTGGVAPARRRSGRDQRTDDVAQ